MAGGPPVWATNLASESRLRNVGRHAAVTSVPCLVTISDLRPLALSHEDTAKAITQRRRPSPKLNTHQRETMKKQRSPPEKRSQKKKKKKKKKKEKEKEKIRTEEETDETR